MYIHIYLCTYIHVGMCVYMYIFYKYTIISVLYFRSHIWNPLMLFAIFHVSAQTKVISRLWKWQRVNN